MNHSTLREHMSLVTEMDSQTSPRLQGQLEALRWVKLLALPPEAVQMIDAKIKEVDEALGYAY